MISTNTPAGTRIVCIKRPTVGIKGNDWELGHVDVGAVCTVSSICAHDEFKIGFGVELVEVPDVLYGLPCFELAALPKAITDCLETVDLPLIIEEFKREDADAAMRRLLPYA